MSKTYLQGIYRPKYPNKYKGDLRNIVFRSGWELKMFKYCDYHSNIIEWSSESIIIPYQHPISGEYKRYFVDIWIKHKTKDGQIKEKLIEIKPRKQLEPPPKQKRKTKRYLKEVETFVVNTAKWNAANKYAKKRGMDFMVFTERELGIN